MNLIALVAICGVTLSCVQVTAQEVAPRDARAFQLKLGNLETEVEMLKQRLETQEQSNEALSKETSSILKSTQETLARAKTGTDSLKKNQDKSSEKLASDIKILKEHLNELGSTVAGLTKQVQTCIENDATRAKQIQDLEAALRSLTAALSPKTTASTGDTYVVKSGDSLGTIAKEHGITIRQLKELNELTSDTIRPGQQLKTR